MTTPTATFTRAQVWDTINTAIEAGFPPPEYVHVFDKPEYGRPWVSIKLSSMPEAQLWGRWIGSEEPSILRIAANRATNYEWDGYRGGWHWKFDGDVPDGPEQEALAAAILTPDAEPLPAGVDGRKIGARP